MLKVFYLCTGTSTVKTSLNIRSPPVAQSGGGIVTANLRWSRVCLRWKLRAETMRVMIVMTRMCSMIWMGYPWPSNISVAFSGSPTGHISGSMYFYSMPDKSNDVCLSFLIWHLNCNQIMMSDDVGMFLSNIVFWCFLCSSMLQLFPAHVMSFLLCFPLRWSQKRPKDPPRRLCSSCGSWDFCWSLRLGPTIRQRWGVPIFTNRATDTQNHSIVVKHVLNILTCWYAILEDQLWGEQSPKLESNLL